MPDEHDQLENNWAVYQLDTTSDFAPGNKIFSWFIGGLNYQIEHHLFPNISHIHYKNIAKIVQQTARKYDLPYFINKSFSQAIHQHINMLKMLGRPGLISQPNVNQSIHTVVRNIDGVLKSPKVDNGYDVADYRLIDQLNLSLFEVAQIAMVTCVQLSFTELRRHTELSGCHFWEMYQNRIPGKV